MKTVPASYKFAARASSGAVRDAELHSSWKLGIQPATKLPAGRLKTACLASNQTSRRVSKIREIDQSDLLRLQTPSPVIELVIAHHKLLCRKGEGQRINGRQTLQVAGYGRQRSQ